MKKDTIKEMSERTKSQWSGQFFTAGELTRRGYWVSIPLGNAPSTDIIAVSPFGETANYTNLNQTSCQDS